MIDLIALRLAPSLAAGLIAYSHMGQIGEGLIVFTCVLIATQAIVSVAAAAARDAGEPGAPRARGPARRRRGGLAGRARRRRELPVLRIRGGRARRLAGDGARRLDQGALRRRAAGPGRRHRTARVRRRFRRRARARPNVRTYDVVGWISPSGPADVPAACAGSARSTRSARRSSPRASICSSAVRARASRGRPDRGHLRSGRRRLPRPAGAPDRRQPALRGDLRPRPGRDDRRRLVPLHHAPAVPCLGPVSRSGSSTSCSAP